ncbi:threonylcarbamoyl-AMP synthase [Halonotius terrestris]|uniref:L-threonylcarbamoyladenylate synthase n=1 Tax=Halonotius terrestris TaxID=2487750 RepID=A0A8J8PAP6_9EURY|nr:L-threonylcarbamoyladenylate synthase [Halonotius terrestris]TQQ82811.1 threonylcarbamoyl-AMP synthase [Halonotius terrestris]
MPPADENAVGDDDPATAGDDSAVGNDGPSDNVAAADAIDAAAAAIQQGEAVVYPTETVYGLGADATDPDAVRRVFEIKDRPRSKPLSVAFADREMAEEYVAPTERERNFIETFLPGPVTVLVEQAVEFPAVLTDGRPTVGVRIADNAVARELVRQAGPITATSANESGSPSVRRVQSLSASVREAVGSVIDTGETAGTESTVVNVETGEIHRRGALADEIEAWLADN